MVSFTIIVKFGSFSTCLYSEYLVICSSGLQNILFGEHLKNYILIILSFFIFDCRIHRIYVEAPLNNFIFKFKRFLCHSIYVRIVYMLLRH
jgi:hypothetical protein